MSTRHFKVLVSLYQFCLFVCYLWSYMCVLKKVVSHLHSLIFSSLCAVNLSLRSERLKKKNLDWCRPQSLDKNTRLITSNLYLTFTVFKTFVTGQVDIHQSKKEIIIIITIIITLYIYLCTGAQALVLRFRVRTHWRWHCPVLSQCKQVNSLCLSGHSCLQEVRAGTGGTGQWVCPPTLTGPLLQAPAAMLWLQG